jgi:capsule polysaccharide modification protein KpsS
MEALRHVVGLGADIYSNPALNDQQRRKNWWNEDDETMNGEAEDLTFKYFIHSTQVISYFH